MVAHPYLYVKCMCYIIPIEEGIHLIKHSMRKLGTLALAITVVAGTAIIGNPLQAQAAPSEAYTWKNVVTGGEGASFQALCLIKKSLDCSMPVRI